MGRRRSFLLMRLLRGLFRLDKPKVCRLLEIFPLHGRGKISGEILLMCKIDTLGNSLGLVLNCWELDFDFRD